MYRYNIFALQRDIKRKLSTSNPSASLDIYGAIDEGRRGMVKRIAPPELARSSYLEQAVYEDPDRYAVPADFNYDDALELKRLAGYRNVDTLDHPFELIFRKRFGQKRRSAKNVMNISYKNGLKTAGLFHPSGIRGRQSLLISNCDSLDVTNNGTFLTGGNVVNLTIDKLNYVQGKGALKFDFNDSGTEGFIENTLPQSINLFEYLQVGANFASFSVDLPRSILAVRFRLYSSDTDFYEFTVNGPHDNNVFGQGWNVMKFLFDQQYASGNPNPKALVKWRMDFTTDQKAIPACRLDSIFSRKGHVYELTYQSAFCIIDGKTGLWKHRATQGIDLVPFEDDSYQVFMLECTLVLQQELYANNAASEQDVIKIKSLLEEAYAYYGTRHPNETMEEYDTMYIMGNEYDGNQDDAMDDGWEGHHGSNDQDEW